MPKYCYIPFLDEKMKRVTFGRNVSEITDIEGGWPEALDLNLKIGVGADEVIAMYICYLTQHWSIYDYLMNLKFIELLTITNFLSALVHTGSDKRSEKTFDSSVGLKAFGKETLH